MFFSLCLCFALLAFSVLICEMFVLFLYFSICVEKGEAFVNFLVVFYFIFQYDFEDF